MGARLNGIEKVEGSNPSGSTNISTRFRVRSAWIRLYPETRTGNNDNTARVISHLPESQGHRVRALAAAPAECERSRRQAPASPGPNSLARSKKSSVLRSNRTSCQPPPVTTRYRGPKRPEFPASRVVPRSSPSSLLVDGGFLFKNAPRPGFLEPANVRSAVCED